MKNKTIITAVAVLSLTVSQFCMSQEGNLQLTEEKGIPELLTLYKSALSTNEYYRIQVGFGDHEDALRIKSRVEIDFPDLPSKIDFDSPTYRVRTGRFKTRLEAERMFIKIRAKYPTAMLLKPKKSTK